MSNLKPDTENYRVMRTATPTFDKYDCFICKRTATKKHRLGPEDVPDLKTQNCFLQFMLGILL